MHQPEFTDPEAQVFPTKEYKKSRHSNLAIESCVLVSHGDVLEIQQ